MKQALSRLVRQGQLQRLRRGLYQYPRRSPVLDLPVVASPDQVMHAWARKNGLRIVPSGAHAANLLGLTTQVPAKLEYCTNGPSKTILLGSIKVQVKRRGPRTMDVRGRMSAAVFEALRHLGKGRVGEQEVRHLTAILSAKDKAQLGRNLPLAPEWMRPALKAIAAGGLD